MTDPDGDQAWDRTQRWGGRPLPPPPGRVQVLPADDDAYDPRSDGDAYDELWHDDAPDGSYDDAYDGSYDDAYDVRPVRRPRDPLWRLVVRGAGELLVTAGLVVLLFVVYEVYVTDLINGRTQSQLSDQIHQQWAAGPPATSVTPMTAAPPVGQPFAVLHIPRLGANSDRVVLEGTAEDELSKGPGHYIGSALPGQVGNLAFAGHRVGKGSPFLDLDQLRPGDPIVVETADGWYVYRVLGDPATGDFSTDPSGIPGQEIVQPTQVSVISPTPDAAADAPATGAYLTLTTCHPKYSAHQRMVIHAKLDGAPISKADAPNGPPALTQG